MEITQLQPIHAEDAARLHIAGQPETFLTKLGPEILSLFYQTLPQTPGCFGFVMVGQMPASQIPHNTDTTAIVMAAPTCLGFVAATQSTGRLFVELGTRHLLHFIPHLLRRYIQQPKLLWYSIETLIYPLLAHGSARDEVTEHPAASAELLSIMVAPELRSQGIGHQLLETLVAACQEHELTALDVTVDATNLAAQRFYERHGFISMNTFTLYGRRMCHYRRALTAGGASLPTKDTPIMASTAAVNSTERQPHSSSGGV